jgi:hypothetical protein
MNQQGALIVIVGGSGYRTTAHAVQRRRSSSANTSLGRLWLRFLVVITTSGTAAAGMCVRVAPEQSEEVR